MLPLLNRAVELVPEVKEHLSDKALEVLGLKYDPSQPRTPAGNEDGGQWSRMIENSLPPDSINDFMESRWKSETESALIVGNGIPIRVIGQNHKHEVVFSEEELKMMTGKTLIHNHPSSSALSKDDFILAEKANLENITTFGYDRYSNQKVIWSADRPVTGWPSPDKIKSAYKIYEGAYIIRARDMIKNQGIDSYQAAHWAANEIMVRVAERVGIRMVKNVSS